MINSIQPPEVAESVDFLPKKALVESLITAMDTLVAKYNTLSILKKNNPNNTYVNTKVGDIHGFSVILTTIVLLHDPHTFFSGRSLEAIKTLLIEDAGYLNIVMTISHLYYSELAMSDISVKDALTWFNNYYSSMQMTEEDFNLLSKESVSVINEPKVEMLLASNIWLLPLFLLVIHPQLVDKFTYIQ